MAGADKKTTSSSGNNKSEKRKSTSSLGLLPFRFSAAPVSSFYSAADSDNSSTTTNPSDKSTTAKRTRGEQGLSYLDLESSASSSISHSSSTAASSSPRGQPAQVLATTLTDPRHARHRSDSGSGGGNGGNVSVDFSGTGAGVRRRNSHQGRKSKTPATDALFRAIRNSDVRNQFTSADLFVQADFTCVRDGRTPLGLAVERGFNKTVKAMAQVGADVSFAPPGIDSPLGVAVRSGDLSMVEFLLDLGADPDGKVAGTPCAIDPPLLVAAERGRLDIARLLLQRRANADLAPPGRPRPLFAAAAKGRRELSQMLLTYGADPVATGAEARWRTRAFQCVPELELWEFAAVSPEFSSLADLLDAVDTRSLNLPAPADSDERLVLKDMTWEWEVPELIEVALAETGKLDLRNEVVLVDDSPRVGSNNGFSLRCVTVGQWIEELPTGADRRFADELLDYIASPTGESGEADPDWSGPFKYFFLGSGYGTPIHIKINRRGVHVRLADVIAPGSRTRSSASAIIEWLCKALQPPSVGAGFDMSRSKYRLERFSDDSDDAGRSTYKIRINAALDKTPLPKMEFGCWKRLFSSCNVVRQQLQRSLLSQTSDAQQAPGRKGAVQDFGRGLEMSFDLMACLAVVGFPLVIDGGVVFVGYDTILVPTAISEDRGAVQFHLITHPGVSVSEGQINPYTVDLGARLRGRPMKTEWLRSRRCFLGWCAEAQINLGTRHLSTQVGYSLRGRPVERSAVVDGFDAMFELGTGQGVSALVGVQTPYRFTSHRRQFTPFASHCKLLRDTAGEVAAIYDAKERRCWLVPKLSLLMHMCHAYVRLSCAGDGQPSESNIPFLEPHADAADIIRALEPFGDLSVVKNSSSSGSLLLGQLLVGLNTNLLSVLPAAKPFNPKQSKVCGFEFLDVITTPGRGSCMKPVTVSTSSHSWLEIVPSADAIVVCAGIGDVITPVPHPSRRNPICNIAPRGRDYLAATVLSLGRLARRRGEELIVSSHPGLLTPSLTSISTTTTTTRTSLIPPPPFPVSSSSSSSSNLLPFLPHPASSLENNLNSYVILPPSLLSGGGYPSVRLSETSLWNISGDPFDECTHDVNCEITCWDRKDALQQLESRSPAAAAGRGVLLKKVFDGGGAAAAGGGGGGAGAGAGGEGVVFGTGTISGSVGAAAAGRGRVALGSGVVVRDNRRNSGGGGGGKTKKYVRAIPKAGAVVFGRPRQG